MPKINNPIEPINPELDEYPTHRAMYGQGGLRTVKDYNERDNLPYNRCEEGMIVYVKDSAEFWYLKTNSRDPLNRVWTLFEGGGGGGGEIDDEHISASKTWSSYKINNEIKNIIDDDKGLGDTENAWSADRTYSDIRRMVDDDRTVTTNAWSSEETKQRISDKLPYKTEFGNLDNSLTIFTSNPLKDGLRLIANQDSSTVALRKEGMVEDITLEYSLNELDWENYTIGEVISLEKSGDYVVFRNRANQNITLGNNIYYYFAMTGSIRVDGNVNYLYRNDGSEFTLRTYQYQYLFKDCTSLTTPPQLPTSSGVGCFKGMFSGCTNLTKAPFIPFVETPVTESYALMFQNCSSLKISDTRVSTAVDFFTFGTGVIAAGTNMFTGTGGTFTGNPTPGKTYYFYE